MGDTIWLALQAIGTMVIVIGLAYWSYRRTRRMREEHRPRHPSALARETPDPQFKPDAEVTDPYHVTDAPHDPSRPAAANPAHRTDAPHPVDPSELGPRGDDRPADARTAEVLRDGTGGVADVARQSQRNR